MQFRYGEDGLEVIKQKHLKEFTFLAENYITVSEKLHAREVEPKLRKRDAGDEQKDVLRSIRKGKPKDPCSRNSTRLEHTLAVLPRPSL